MIMQRNFLFMTREKLGKPILQKLSTVFPYMGVVVKTEKGPQHDLRVSLKSVSWAFFFSRERLSFLENLVSISIKKKKNIKILTVFLRFPNINYNFFSNSIQLWIKKKINKRNEKYVGRIDFSIFFSTLPYQKWFLNGTGEGPQMEAQSFTFHPRFIEADNYLRE